MKDTFQKIALWVKEYKHPLRVIGGIFFVLAIIAGLFWAAGKDIEPIAFLLGMLSSLFLASPSVAEFIVPDRKSVRHMTYQELLDFILTTDAKADWHRVSTSISSEYFLKEDPRLRFKARHTEEGVQHDDFKEPWANSHPKSHATGYWHELYYDGDFIERFILVAVDGAAAMLPPPDFRTKKIEPLNYRVAEIFDVCNSLDQYILRSKLELSEYVTKSASRNALTRATVLGDMREDMIDSEIEPLIKKTLKNATGALIFVFLVCLVSFIADIVAGAENRNYWFQRSGAIAVVLVACIEYWLIQIANSVRPSISSYVADNQWSGKYGKWYDRVKLVSLFFLVSGTALWGYGDLLFKTS